MTTPKLRRLAAVLALLLVGCAEETNPFAALTTTGELAADGGGECGAVAIGPDLAITNAHCVVGGPVYYHAPGEREGRRVRLIYADEALDVACLRIETGLAGDPVAPIPVGVLATLESNVSGVVTGEFTKIYRGGVAEAALTSREGDSGSAVRIETGEVVGLLTGGFDAANGKATRSKVTPAEWAVALCPGV